MQTTSSFNAAWFIDILLILLGLWSLGRTKVRAYRIAAAVPVFIGLLGLVSLIIHSFAA